MPMRVKAEVRGKKCPTAKTSAFRRDISRAVANVIKQQRLGVSGSAVPVILADPKFCAALVAEIAPRIDWPDVLARLQKETGL